MRNVTVRDFQNLFDVAVQKMGSADAAFELARLNDISVTDALQSGQVLQVPDVPTDDYVVSEFSIKKLFPATSDKANENVRGGIGFMGIGIDFKVS